MKYEKDDIIFGVKIYLIISVMNVLKYDVGILGNYEFNYGFDFFDGMIKGVDFLIVNVNVKIISGDNCYMLYVIKEKIVIDENGNE